MKKALDRPTRLIVSTALRAAGVEPSQILAGLATIEGKREDFPEKSAALLTQAEKAKQLGVSRFTVRKLTKLRRLNPIEILPGLLRYKTDELVNE